MLEQMKELGARLERLREEQRAATAEMHAMIQSAYLAGWSVIKIADTLGVARQTVYTNLKELS